MEREEFIDLLNKWISRYKTIVRFTKSEGACSVDIVVFGDAFIKADKNFNLNDLFYDLLTSQILKMVGDKVTIQFNNTRLIFSLWKTDSKTSYLTQK